MTHPNMMKCHCGGDIGDFYAATNPLEIYMGSVSLGYANPIHVVNMR